jgi:iron complex transport system substrate-binding protein
VRGPGIAAGVRAAVLAGPLLVTALAGCAGAPGAGSSHPAAAAPAGGRSEPTEPVEPWSALTPLSAPRDFVGPTTARVADDRVVPITNRPRPVLPATITDSQGTRVTVASAERILALDIYGSLAATVYALGLGDHLVGRDQSTGFPGTQQLPLVTRGAHVLNAESILRLRPTVIITDTSLGPWDVILQLRDAGVPVVVTPSQRSLTNISTLTTQVAAALGVAAEGRRLSARITAELAGVEAQVDRVVPRSPADRLRIVFLYVRGQSGTYYIFGKGSGADSLIRALDGIDVATAAGIDGFAPLNAEALAKTRPDVILFMSAGLASVGGVAGALKLPGVAETPAGQHRRIVDMSDYEVLSYGPNSARVVDALARALYAPSTGGRR